ncbi:Sterol 24-C-methyltransferase [Penicillium odoratum]|uniref:Sterol 24-C-methyltransferase n=1 Tax=Penicillium odoratum TaxID=1167516 RepID=UPI002546DAA7|nr:Sterol 24-C-methyltransferase [Penicillium odoratum]KAJ5752791.1 Sterol 24-C-methyltransferase [Penicillium odoratum]
MVQLNRRLDAKFSEILHGNSSEARGGLVAMCKKDFKAQKIAVEDYFKHWDNTTSEETEDARLARRAEYASLTQQYYNLVTDLTEHAWNTSFHFCRIAKGEPFSQSIIRHELHLARCLGLGEGQKVLDVGCGIGGPTREIAKFADVHVVGLNNNDYQLQRATRYDTEEDLQDRIHYIKGDFMRIPLESNSFDAAYSIEGTSYAPSLQGVYAEIFRVLKPGATLAVFELILTDAYDNHDPEHRAIRWNIEQGLGITNLVTISVAVEAIKAVGFKLESAEDLADRPSDIPWYHPITRSFKWMSTLQDTLVFNYMAFFLRSFYFHGAAYCFVGGCERLGLLPPGTQKIATRLARGHDALVKGGEKKLFTPLFLMSAKKPLN